MTNLYLANPHTPVELQFKMNGPVFEEGLPLPLMIKSLEAVQGIFDRTYLQLANKRKMSSQDRSMFYLRTSGITRGSLESNLGLIYSAAQLGLPFVSNLGPQGVWEYTKETFSFLKMIFEAKKDGHPVAVTQSGDGSVANVNTGTQNITFNGPVFNIANAALPHYEYLAKQLQPEKVRDIRIGIGSSKDIYLDLPDSRLFELPTKIEEHTHTLQGELFEFDKYNGTGRLSVFAEQTIPKGEYRFAVVGRQDRHDYIEAMLRHAVKVSCLEETVDHPFGGRRVVSLQVTNVDS